MEYKGDEGKGNVNNVTETSPHHKFLSETFSVGMVCGRGERGCYKNGWGERWGIGPEP